MIAVEQIKAARALLNWKQSDLAKAAGLSLPSINNIERAVGSPRTDTVKAIQTALENAGIQFVPGGVLLPDEIFEVRKLEGKNFVKELYDDIFSCMKGPEDEAVMFNIDERKFAKYASDQLMRYYNYSLKVQFKERLIIKHGDTFLLANPSVYRWITPELIGTIPYLVYKDRFVMIMWEKSRAIIIRNKVISDTFRRQFDFLWKLAVKLPSGMKNQLDDPEFVKKLSQK